MHASRGAADPVRCRGPLGNFNATWRRAAGNAKLPGKLFHDLRRTAVRDMVRAGVSPTIAKTISGHRTDAVFERYNITSAEDKLEALRRRESYLEARKEKLNVVALRAANTDGNTDGWS